MSFNPDIHKRRSVRLLDYDYRCAGAYYVTICAFQREFLFGEVSDGEVRLTRFGEIVREEWLSTAVLRPNVDLDAFVVMPNHFHAVIFMLHGDDAHVVRPATENVSPLRRQPGSLGSIVAGFKSAATKRINALRDNPCCPVWQRNYYDHVIRTEKELAIIRQYIADNPAKWDLDENNPVNAVDIP
jgi:REP element-mobilizing transposase RayT